MASSRSSTIHTFARSSRAAEAPMASDQILSLPVPLPEIGALESLVQGWHGDPFALLGPHRDEHARVLVSALLPGALAVHAIARRDGSALGELKQRHPHGYFIGPLTRDEPYRLRIQWQNGAMQIADDAYAFGPLLSEQDLERLADGRHPHYADTLGAHATTIDSIAGTRFAVWAPNARRVSVIGDFNSWDGRRHAMRMRHRAGVWELFIPGIVAGTVYKYEVLTRDGTRVDKADPVARASELPPSTASVVGDPRPLRWSDDTWMAQRKQRQAANAPLSVYEMHTGSWLRISEDGGRSLDWNELADRLVPYVADMGFTHIELMPIMEHPFYGSWGYQPLGLFSPTARHGRPEDFGHFVDRCHAAGIGVLLDWVPAHFPSDRHGLAQFDGSACYEHGNPLEGFHKDWNTLIYNLGRNEVRNFLFGSAIEWLERYHVDGLRVDAVASMLYRDYSRKAGEWIPNRYGGRENLEAIDFLRDLNRLVTERCPGAVVIAEESTAFPQVSGAVEHGGLGFNYKWNMGWMHDTLHFMETDTIYRRWHYDSMTFGLIYAFSERFMLPLSHDEVVYGKGSLIGKMPGDPWQKFANLRAYYGFMWAHPGKKLMFMGGEIAQWREWNHDGSIEWDLLDQPMHRGMQRLVRDLNHHYAAQSALHAKDSEPAGFDWAVANDAESSVLAFLRWDSRDAAPVLAISNLTPVARRGYRIGVPQAGYWRELLNTDAAMYGGSNQGNNGGVHSDAGGAHGHAQSLVLDLPPLATLWLMPS
ncbi:MAG: 1,4-alpha-glucan branching enzyme [Hydrocarboniphaga sp.]|nr:1,4-alpha-glucan branching enzyme [Hydrocarboniphaga sp.]